MKYILLMISLISITGCATAPQQTKVIEKPLAEQAEEAIQSYIFPNNSFYHIKMLQPTNADIGKLIKSEKNKETNITTKAYSDKRGLFDLILVELIDNKATQIKLMKKTAKGNTIDELYKALSEKLNSQYPNDMIYRGGENIYVANIHFYKEKQQWIDEYIKEHSRKYKSFYTNKLNGVNPVLSSIKLNKSSDFLFLTYTSHLYYEHKKQHKEKIKEKLGNL